MELNPNIKTWTPATIVALFLDIGHPFCLWQGMGAKRWVLAFFVCLLTDRKKY